MDFTQLIAVLGPATPQAIFAGLFIWLFTKDRDESRQREIWFREAVEKNRVALEASTEQQKQQTSIMQQMALALSRIESSQSQSQSHRREREA